MEVADRGQQRDSGHRVHSRNGHQALNDLVVERFGGQAPLYRRELLAVETVLSTVARPRWAVSDSRVNEETFIPSSLALFARASARGFCPCPRDRRQQGSPRARRYVTDQPVSVAHRSAAAIRTSVAGALICP
ncbi:hypothetical protein ACFXJ5_41190, partial [Streptomyces sp. NPDC059373]